MKNKLLLSVLLFTVLAVGAFGIVSAQPIVGGYGLYGGYGGCGGLYGGCGAIAASPCGGLYGAGLYGVGTGYYGNGIGLYGAGFGPSFGFSSLRINGLGGFGHGFHHRW